jgi:hypothetical protein
MGKDIADLSMGKDTAEEIKRLEERLQELKAAQVVELEKKLREARRVVRDLEQQIEKVSGKPVSQSRRKRMRSHEVRERIESVLNKAKGGLSQKDISEQSEINYQTVALYLKRNQKDFKVSGSRKSKRYFLK